VKRRLFNALAAVSLVLLLAAGAVCVRSLYRDDFLTWSKATIGASGCHRLKLDVESSRGGVFLHVMFATVAASQTDTVQMPDLWLRPSRYTEPLPGVWDSAVQYSRCLKPPRPPSRGASGPRCIYG
jgi:hypothetical protein